MFLPLNSAVSPPPLPLRLFPLISEPFLNPPRASASLRCFKQKGAGSLGLTVEVLVWEIIIIWTKWSTMSGPGIYIKHLPVFSTNRFPFPDIFWFVT